MPSAGAGNSWHVAGTQEGNSQAPCLHCAVFVVQRHEQAVEVDLAIGAPGHVANDHGAMRFEQRPWRFQPARRVVIAGNDDDIELRTASARLLQETVELALRRGRWVAVVKDIAGNQQRIDILLHKRVEQPVEEALVLVAALESMQGLAQVPVGGVQQAHGIGYLESTGWMNRCLI